MTLCHVLDDCEPIEMDCSACHGEGRRGDAYCLGCGGTGCEFFSRSSLYVLAHNLAIGAGLCRAFELGFDEGWNVSGEGFNSEYSKLTSEQYRAMRGAVMQGDWRPGCGRSAP